MSGFDLQTALEFLLLIATAYVLALPIGWDQEKEQQSAGIRVFPIMSSGACAFILIAGELPGGDVQTQARVIVGVISAVGFLSGGAILKDSTGTAARGIAAAASIWVTGAIGVAVAVQQFVLAVILSVTVYFTHKVLRPAGDVARDGEPNAEEEKSEKENRGNQGEKAKKKEQSGKDENREEEEEEPPFGGGRYKPRNASSPAWAAQLGEQPRISPEPSNLSNNRGNDAATASQTATEGTGASPPEGTPASIMGVLVTYKDVTVQGLTHRVGLIRDEKEAEYLVDLGPADRLNNLALARGMYMMVHGWVTWVGNRQGLRASQVLFNGGVIDIGGTQ